MNISNRREKEKETMKKNIMASTITLINQNGYENLTIRKIASEIGYSPTTIYLYYKDKADIIEDMSNGLYRKTVDNIKKIINESNSLKADKLLRLCLVSFVHSLTNEPEIAKAVLTSNQNVIYKEQKDSEQEDGTAILTKLLDKCKQEEKYSRIEDNTALLILTALLGFVLNSISNEFYLMNNYENLINSYIDMITLGLK